MFVNHIETLLLRKRIPVGTLTLYHGTTVKTKTIKPLSINVGTKLSSVRKSSFWTPDFHYAVKHIIGRYIYEGIYEHTGNNNLEYILHPTLPKIFLNQALMKDLQNYLRDKKVYIYQTIQPVKNLGAGHTKEQLEYSIDMEVVPNKIVELGFANIYTYLEPQDSEQFKITQKKIIELYNSQSYDWLQRTFFYDLAEMKRRKREINKKR